VARLLAVVGLALIVVGGGPDQASAHGDLLQASPGPGQQAGGTIDFIDLAFLETANEVVVEVAHDGATVPGAMEVADGRIIRFAFDQPLTSPGRYDVSYTLTSGDEDRYTESYYFTYEPASPQAFRLGTVDPSPSGGGWPRARTVAVLVVVTVMIGLAFVYLMQLERQRSAVADEE
jgi:methionine-rich copper-binding protein CopC